MPPRISSWGGWEKGALRERLSLKSPLDLVGIVPAWCGSPAPRCALLHLQLNKLQMQATAGWLVANQRPKTTKLGGIPRGGTRGYPEGVPRGT